MHNVLQDHQEKDTESHRGRTFLSISVLFKTAGTLIWPVITTVPISMGYSESLFIMNWFSIGREMNCYSWYTIGCDLIFLIYMRTEVTIAFVCCMGAGFFLLSELCTDINQFSINKPYDKPINTCYHYHLFLLTRAEFLLSLQWKAKVRLGSTGPEIQLRAQKASITSPVWLLQLTSAGEEVKVSWH